MSRRKSPLLSNSPFHGIAANLSHLLGGNHLQHCTYRPFSWHTEATNTDLAVRSSPHMLNEKDGESNWKVRSVMKSKRSEKFRCDTSPVAQLNYLLSMGNQVCGKINYESSSWWGIEGGGGVGNFSSNCWLANTGSNIWAQKSHSPPPKVWFW